MIYFVSNQKSLFESKLYKEMTTSDAINTIASFDVIQFDTETSGKDPHIAKLLLAQFGNKKQDIQIVVDCTTIDITLFKTLLETKFIIGQNLKFDLQFLYNYGIIPLRIYDTMIVEQLLHLGFPSAGMEGGVSYSLQAIAQKYLGIYIDKTVRGQIQYTGINESVIVYSATDVIHLENIMLKQLEVCKAKSCLLGAKLECDFVPVISYLEWCGIKLDEDKWLQKMTNDKKALKERKSMLDSFLIKNGLSKYYSINRQGDLFSGFSLDPVCNINWDSSTQVVKLAKELGFNTITQNKKTGGDKDSVLEKYLKGQKGINDEFLKLYFDYKESSKVCSTYGQGHLNAINPITGRIHTIYKQLGASSGRMSCGSKQSNTDLAKLKGIPPSSCSYPNIQQLPADEPTRSSFICEKGNVFCSCDYSAMESYLGADIYEDIEFQNEFLYGSKDTHSLFAWMVFRKECEELGCICVADVKSKAAKWRKAVKAVEFAYMFGAAAPTISQSANCSVEQAQEYINALDKGFVGISRFAKEGSKFVRKNGYVLINKYTGHKLYWWDHNKWLERQRSFTSEFWDDYRTNHKGTDSLIAQEVRQHFQAASKWDRLARNSPTQGSGACIMKRACTEFFKWIVANNYFDTIKLVALVHDEVCIEYPKELENIDKKLEYFMEEASKEYCKFSKIPAEASTGDHWIH